jgi:hypothetical protein
MINLSFLKLKISIVGYKRKILQGIKKLYLPKKVFQRWTLCSKKTKIHLKMDPWIALKSMRKIMINFYIRIQEFKACKQRKIVKIKDTYTIWINLFKNMII